MALPTLTTPRLTLRPLVPADAPRVRLYAGDMEVAANTLRMPHPYEEGMAEAWMAGHPEAFARFEDLVLALALRPSGELVGCVGLVLSETHRHGELGYWVARPWWGQGLASEAARAVVHYAFSTLALHRVFAQHFTRNPASGRVLQKLGMRHEGHLRQHYCRFGEWLDVDVYGLLASEWQP
jgi:RimJ/RimL family protein N-acetyltransferase